MFADGLALSLGIRHASQRTEELLRRINVHKGNVVVIAEQANHLPGFVQTHQAVIDEYAGQLRANRLVNQHRRHRTIDAARQSTDDAAFANLGADFGDHLAPVSAHRPIGFQPSDFVYEIRDQLGAVRGVHDLGVEHGRIDAARLIGRDGKWRVLARGLDREALRQLRDAVAVAHPHRIAFARFPQAIEQRALLHDLDVGTAKLRRVPAFDNAAELDGRCLLAIADRENGNPSLEYGVGRARAVSFGHRRRTT